MIITDKPPKSHELPTEETHMTAETMAGAAAYRPTLVDRIRWKVEPAIYRVRKRLGLLPKSNLERHAERELSRLMGDGADSDDMQRIMNKHLLRMVRVFANEGHSGFSAGYAVSMLEKLLRFDPIGPLTGDDDEWMDISDSYGSRCWQNTRCGRVFKGEDGRAYDIDGRVFREASGVCFTGQGSRVYVTFPYAPTTEYVDVGEDGEPLNGPSREELAAA